ncbi:helix-turn-helix domain-containing protein [Agrobacterium rhizogenes]|nr:helix-turn-helix domain-containing protein [Rhizobium rhizogenes]NTI54609.1 helix-turn-helix domain-containing protein [Rhizobium rhizogenes]
MAGPLLTPEEAANRLSISQRQLRDLTDEGLLRWINIGLGKKRPTRRYTDEDVDAFIEERSQRCRSTRETAKRPTRMTSSSGAVDFLAILAKRQSEQQKPSKTDNGKSPRRT